MSVEPGASFGSYTIIAQIGRGGMATVYQAYQPALDRHVALKVLPAFFAEDRDFVTRFQREAVAIARLRHPNILAAFDYGEQDGMPYLVTEYVEGGTLADRLGQPLPVDYTVHLLEAVASALDYAHAEGILHRDLKPSNVLLARDGTPILSDFGLATMIGSLPRLTQTGTLVGTPEYMAPEYGTGGPVGPPADLYALAVVSYEMLTGRVPFEAETPLAVLLAHIHRPLPLPRSVNPALTPAVEAVLLKGLAKSPEDRYPTAADFAVALATAAQDVAGAAAGPDPAVGAGRGALPERASPPVGGSGAAPVGRVPRPVLLFGALAVAVAVAGLSVLGVSRDWGKAFTPESAGGGPDLPACPTKISFGETIKCDIEIPSEVDTYAFAAGPGDLVRVRAVEDAGNIVASVQVLNPAGAIACGPSIAGELDCRIDSSGSHAISVKDGTGDGTRTGGYVLHLQRLNGPVGCAAIFYGSTRLAGAIDFPAKADCFTFTGARDDQLRLTWVRTAGDLVPSVQVLRPDGSGICGPAISGDLECRLDAAGQHTIMLGDGPTPRLRTGVYALDLTCLGGPCRTTASGAPDLPRV